MKYRVKVTIEANVKEIQFLSAEDGAPLLSAIYVRPDEMPQFKESGEVDLQPEDRAKWAEEARGKRERDQATAQAKSMESLGEAKNGSDGTPEPGTQSKPAPVSLTTPAVDTGTPPPKTPVTNPPTGDK